MEAMTSTILPVVAERFGVGESLVWNAANGELMWCDIPAGTIHALAVATGARRQWTFGEAVGSFGLCRSGRLIVALVEEIIVFDPATGRREPIARIEHAKPGMRLNDGKVGPDGAFWVGSMDPDREHPPAARLYRVAPDGDVGEIADGIAVSNGLAWNRAGTRLYHSDSRGAQWIDIWDFDRSSGAVHNRRRFAEAGDAVGRADGGACDIEDNYWSCGPWGSRVNRFSATGHLIDWIEVPVLRPTMPCFGGDDMRTLYIASLSSGVSEDLLRQNPLCGGIVSLRAPVEGVPVARFAD